MKSPTLFVIGARGYVGGVLFARARSLGFAVGTSSSGGGGFLPLKLDAPSGFNYHSISAGDIVFLTAAVSAPDICARQYDYALAVNVAGTSSFIQHAMERGARIIFFSSDTVYGGRASEFDETAKCEPAGEYAEMKHMIEERFIGNPLFKTIRLSYIFSREDKFTRYLIGCLSRNEVADIFHPFFRAVVYREDVIDGVLRLAAQWDEFPDRVFNFGGPQLLSRIDMVNCIREEFCSSLRFNVTQPDDDFFKNRPRIIAMSSPQFSKILGRSPRTLGEAVRLDFGTALSQRSN